MIENPVLIDPIIRRALEEDLGPADLTTEAIVSPESRGKAVLFAREELVLAGLAVFRRVFDLICSDLVFEANFLDGQVVPPEGRICVLSGPLASILEGERTALNFLQRMSGIATLTRRYVDRVRSYEVRVVDTRKTAPGLRLLDKYAVRTGGGFNHRMGLFDGILIKDNHIAAAGSVRRAVTLAKKSAPHTVKVEVEVEDLGVIEEAIEAGADVVLLDNMPPHMVREAVKMIRGRAKTEASGNINLDNIEAYAQAGVDIISVGALTHSARAANVSLELTPS